VYEIRDKMNNKVYIGSTRNFSKRWGTHIADLRRNRHHSPNLQESYNKYGENNFNFNIIEYVEDFNDLLLKEQRWMDLTESYNEKTGYNVSRTAKGRTSPVSNLTRLRMAKAQTGRKHSEETLEKLRFLKKKSSLSAETRAKYSAANKGENNNMAVLSEIEVIEIKEKLRDGIKRSKIASEYDVTQKNIDMISAGKTWVDVKVEGFIPKVQPKKLKEDDVILIKKMLMEGFSQKEICEEFNISSSLVSGINNEKKWKRVLVEGFKTVETNSTKKLKRKDVLEIREMLSQSLSVKIIAEKFNVSTSVIYSIKNGEIHKDII